MKEISLYDPFQSFDLVGAKCFLSGIPVSKGIDTMSVFPYWLMEEENLFDKPFKLLDETFCTYADLKLGVSADVHQSIIKLQEKIKQAFDTSELETISEIEWFQWSAIIVYGLVSAEIKNGLKSDEYKEEGFRVSPILVQKFRTLHNLLQSLILPFEFDSPKPFSLFLFKLNVDDTVQKLEHRNEINTLTFSFRYKNIGVLICLLDEEYNKVYHQKILEKISNKNLDVIQFEEFAAKVYYSNYLFSLIPEFQFNEHMGKIYVSTKETGIGKKNIFENWDEKTYAQVLEAFWKPWNYSRVEILKNPEKAMSFID